MPKTVRGFKVDSNDVSLFICLFVQRFPTQLRCEGPCLEAGKETTLKVEDRRKEACGAPSL